MPLLVILNLCVLCSPCFAKDTHDTAAGLALPRGAALFRELGKRAGIKAIVDRAMVKFLSDVRIKAKFDDENIPRLKGMLTDYFCMITGGPDQYKGYRDMKVVHEGLHLRDRDFNALVEDLQSAMNKEHIPFRTQNKFLAILAPMQHDVVSR
jgi:hemoglobin